MYNYLLLIHHTQFSTADSNQNTDITDIKKHKT